MTGERTAEAARMRRHAAAVLAVLVVLAGVLAFTARSRVNFSPVNQQVPDSFDRIVLAQAGGGQVSFEIGIPLRQVAGAKLQDLRIPDRRHVVEKMTYDRDVLNAQILRLLLRGRVTVADYDPRVPDAAIAQMRQKNGIHRMGRWPVWIFEKPATRYVLRTDEAMKEAYIVPAEIDATLPAYTATPLPPDEPQRGPSAEIP